MRNCVSTVTTVLIAAACAAGADWPQFLGRGRDGIAPDVKVAPSWPAEGPQVLWTVELGAGYGGPSIEGGKVYLLDRVANARDVLRCFELATGRELWTFSYDASGKLDHDGSRSAPTVGPKYIFTVGPFGHFFCFDKAAQRRVWNKHLLTDFRSNRPNWGVAQSPVLYKDSVIVAPLGRLAGVVAFEKATGKMLWKSPPLGRMEYTSPMLTQIGGVDQVLIMSKLPPRRAEPRADPGSQPARRRRPPPPPTQVAGVDANTGKLLWTYESYSCQIQIPSAMHLGDGRVFVTGGYDAGSAMFRVVREGDKFAVTELFKLEQPGSQLHNALLHEGHLYLNCNTNSKRDGLVCMDLDGNVKWQTSRRPSFDRGNLILVGGVILIMGGVSGVLRMVRPDPGGYKQVAETKVLSGREIWAPMAYSDGKLVVRDQRQMKCLLVGGKAE